MTSRQGYDDLKHDDVVGFQIITTDDIEEMRIKGIVEAIKRRVKDTPCYLSIDIDV
jgi:agmatinase